MWATLNPYVKKLSRLQLLAVGLVSAGLLGLLGAETAHGADLTGVWQKNGNVISVKTSDNKEYFNLAQDGGRWYAQENIDGGINGAVMCQRRVYFTGDPRTSAQIAASGTQTERVERTDQTGVKRCVDDATKSVAITGSKLILNAGVPGGTDPTAPPPGGGTGTGGAATATPECDVGSLTFMICPLINFMATATEWVANILQGLLYVKPLSLDTASSENALFRAWSSILSVANIMLAIAFLFVIFAQATSVALSNYGVKRMLPRIIAAAILMNLSYFICAIAVDLSNLIGVGVSGFFASILSGDGIRVQSIFSNPDTSLDHAFGNHPITEVAAGVGVGAILIFFFLPPVLLAALAVLFTLAARLAIIVLLVIVAPLAFAAWILPNTEKYFKKWYELFISMLVLFPLVMLVFSGATVASNLVMETSINAGDMPGVTPTFTQTVLLPLIALLIQALPLFALPILFKTASGLLGRINAMTQSTMNDRLGGKQASDFFYNTRKRGMQNLGARMAGNERQTKLGRAGRFIGGFKARRDFNVNSQKANAERIQQEALAKRAVENKGLTIGADENGEGGITLVKGLATRAGGAAGDAGMYRAKGSAAATLSKAMNESVDNEIKTLEYEALKSGQTLKDYSKGIVKQGITESSKPFAERKIRSSVLEAAMEAQAREKDMSLFEEIRGTSENRTGVPTGEDIQTIMSRVVSRNVGNFKGAGGFHLQADPNLRREAFAAGAAGDDQWKQALRAAQIGSLSNTDALNMNSLKWSWLSNVSKEIDADATGFVQASRTIAQKEVAEGKRRAEDVDIDLQKTYDNVYEAIHNDNARAAIGDRLPEVMRIEARLREQGFAPTLREVDNATSPSGGATTTTPAPSSAGASSSTPQYAPPQTYTGSSGTSSIPAAPQGTYQGQPLQQGEPIQTNTGAIPMGSTPPQAPLPNVAPMIGPTERFQGQSGPGSIPRAPQGTYQGELRTRPPSNPGSYTDERGRQTPNGAGDDYHDGMTR